MKNKANNNATQADLLSPGSSTKPIASGFATAAQIVAQLPFLAGVVDETFLRNRAREINTRTAAPWIPKPRNNHFEINPTILGLLEWFATRAAAAGELPAAYDSATHMANALHLDKSTILWLTKHGAEAAQLGGSRVAPLPVIRTAFEFMGQIKSGNITGIDGMEEINTNRELGLKLREEKYRAERENALAARRIHDLNEVEARVRTEMLMPLRDALQGCQKKFARFKKSQPGIALQIVETDLPKILEKILTTITKTAAKNLIEEKSE